MNNIKVRLAALNFFEFAVWGSYLVSIGIYLSSVGLGSQTFWFYTAQGLVSLFMPAIIGIIADKWIPAQKMLSICHAVAGSFMLLAGWYCINAGTDVRFGTLFTLYTLSIAFFMPTIGLCNSVAFNALNKVGLDTVTAFPPIRMLGTIGFICAELFVNFTEFQTNYWQLITSGVISYIMMIYSLSMPNCPVNPNKGANLAEALGLNAFKLFKNRHMAIFFIFSMLLGVCLQITNSYGTMFIHNFSKIAEFAQTWGANNATALTAISQASEALCILLIPFFLKKFGIKGVMLMAMFAWVLRFGFFGIGNTGSGLIFLILSCIVYGMAFDFFNVAGGLFVDRQTDVKLRSSAQGLFMIMTNGIGASIGTFLAGELVVNKLVDLSPVSDKAGEIAQATTNLAGWRESWFIFATYALIISILFIFIFRTPKSPHPSIDKEHASELTGGDPEGMIENGNHDI
ncbi:MAG: MFS transporter [Prevotella sp.]|nr:MFS transporter [Bacteroides sp.]MCM1366923.1 MFS transporter [Prevotella sp.]